MSSDILNEMARCVTTRQDGDKEKSRLLSLPFESNQRFSRVIAATVNTRGKINSTHKLMKKTKQKSFLNMLTKKLYHLNKPRQPFGLISN